MLTRMFTFPVLCLLVLTAVHLSVSQLTDQQKQDLLNLHNRARSMVDPIATNMEEMEWNDELAAVAQAYSKNCSVLLNPDRASQAPSFMTVGENSGVSTPPTSSSAGQVMGFWFDGRLLYNYATGMCLRPLFCDDYLQLVWATSNQVGCGATVCNSVEGLLPGQGGFLLVCNYGPAGNLEGQSPYMTGASSCSNCPDDKRSCVNNLCSNVSCPLLDPPSNGVIDCTSNEVGGTCTLTCDDGYELTGSASRTCQDNGTWSGTETKCTPVPGLTDEEKQDLLDLHNRARSMVDPIATNMEEMKWNDELAAVAQAYSSKCDVRQPNPDASSEAPSFTSVGENSGVSMPPSSSSFSQVVGLWFDGRQLYNYTTGMCFRDPLCDAYTQLVWATSNQVGCGATVCGSVGGFPSGRSGLVLVCNYGPAGNLKGQSPYMTGASSCFNCPDDKKACVNNLCSNDCNVTKVTIDDVGVDNNTVTVKFSSDPNARFRCRLNNQRFTTCENPVTYTGLTPRRYHFAIQAACSGQRFKDGARRRTRFRVRN